MVPPTTGRGAWWIGLAAVFIAVGLHYYHDVLLASPLSAPHDDRHRPATVLPALAPALTSGVALVDSALVPKYRSDIVSIETQRFLAPLFCAFPPQPASSLESVAVVLARPVVPRDTVFVMLNGASEGLYLTWHDTSSSSCLHALGHAAALALGADADWIALGVRLYSHDGHVVEDIADLDASNRLVHVLLEFQLWMWPGVAVGYNTTVPLDSTHAITLTTASLSPLVFTVSGFFSLDEATAIMSQGQPHLDRSVVATDDGRRSVSTFRTSHTAFLPPSQLTRTFQVRAATLARLPSASFAERLQLVRYGAGEFYKGHLDTFDNKELVPKAWHQLDLTDYVVWADWAAAQIDALAQVPRGFEKGAPLYPNASDPTVFPVALLSSFWTWANATHFFTSRRDQVWNEWLALNVGQNASYILVTLLGRKGHYLPHIVRVWEDQIGLASLRYTFPKKRPPHGMSHWYRWIRMAKEHISALGQAAPPDVQPYGPWYPKFSVDFQAKMLALVYDRLDGQGRFGDFLTVERIAWWEDMRATGVERDVLQEVLQEGGPALVAEFIAAWEEVVQFDDLAGYSLPPYVPHLAPQRYATLFLYLNDVDGGGETVFPYATSAGARKTTEARSAMPECSDGLAVPPTALSAALFYVQTPTQEVDVMAHHGGCPPLRGVKWGANQFLWNADAEEGANVWVES
ncbi:Aste57867_14600 [Aphanomyces stellatus]|uniref:Aste57867_14600 protein n=1 Tax=Aphanomyces stellatus TaxID=120398 RepID=A0A485L1M4_9STRA|nr:hypothetical protein As57867_014546 [Aphanomyces stellatus]VFT91419.1 Aste57867_14600 [Aphanomyces stellatus]